MRQSSPFWAIVVVLLAGEAARADGTLGARAGYAFHSGRSVVVDSVSGASTVEDTNLHTRSSFAWGVAVDVGLALGGSLGLRVHLDGAAPGPFYTFTALPRWRWRLARLEPWVGAGVGVELEGGSGPFVGFPFAAGCDLALGGGWYLTAEAAATAMNPWGPSRTETTGAGERGLEDHLNRLAILLGVALRLF
jgi:hypothetical protein